MSSAKKHFWTRVLFAVVILPGIAYLALRLLPVFKPAAVVSGLAQSESIPAMLKRVMPAIVNISAEVQAVLRGQPMLALNPSTNQPVIIRPLRGVKSTKKGAGVVVSRDGFIITNAHVVEGMTRVRVTVSDGSEKIGDVLGVEPNYDLAVVKVQDPGNVETITFGDSGRLAVGETVIAVGNPHGLGHSVSAGVLSAAGRDIMWKEKNLVYEDLLQSDINLNIGSSGGTLLNGAGELIGINLAAPVGTQGISFAIPSNTVRKVYEEFRAGKPGGAVPA